MKVFGLQIIKSSEYDALKQEVRDLYEKLETAQYLLSKSANELEENKSKLVSALDTIHEMQLSIDRLTKSATRKKKKEVSETENVKVRAKNHD